METLRFEPIREAHLGEVALIYNYYVENTTVSFHTEMQTAASMKESVICDDPRFASFMILDGDATAGYVLITHHKKKQAYDISGEVTIYLKPDYAGRGIGGQALRFIEEVARKNGFHSLVATICLENEPSKHVFTRNGYNQCAHYKEIGSKFGRLLDIVMFQKILAPAR